MPSGLPASAPPLPLRCPVGGAAAYGVAQPLLPSVAPPQRRAPGAIPRCGGTWVGRGSYPRAVTRPSSWRRRGLRAWPFRLVSISVDVRRAHGPWLFRAALVLGGGGGGLCGCNSVCPGCWAQEHWEKSQPHFMSTGNGGASRVVSLLGGFAEVLLHASLLSVGTVVV